MPLPEIEKNKISKSKYELTLAEFPLFLLSTKTKTSDIKSYKYEDTIAGKNGETVKREWTIHPHGSLGFGTASTLSTLFELFQVWKENDFDSQNIQFGSIYNLLKRKGLQCNKRAYEIIKRDLDCLTGMVIKAKNAFWDNELKAYVDMTFHLFDQVFHFKEKPNGQATLPMGYIKASDILYGSILKNSVLIASFDSKLFHSLTPIEQRLSLYLAKVFRSQTVHKRELMQFAQQIPLQSKEKKKIKQQIKDACNGLITKGFNQIKRFDFEKGSNDQEYIVFYNSNVNLSFRPMPSPKKEEYKIQALVEDILAVCKDDKSVEFYRKVANLLPDEVIYRAISEVKEVRDLGEIKKSKGALFTSLVKKYAQERRIEI